jgi:hypothetical protein
VAPADLFGPCGGLVLPQHADDLFFAEAASFHRPSPFFRRRTLAHFGGVFGVQATSTICAGIPAGIIELARRGRSINELAREFEPTANAIRFHAPPRVYPRRQVENFAEC